MTALIIVSVAAVVWVAAVVSLLVIAWRTYDPEAGETCNLDCRDLYRYGLTAPDCRAPHATDHFATPRDHAQFEADLDWMIRIGEKK